MGAGSERLEHRSQCPQCLAIAGHGGVLLVVLALGLVGLQSYRWFHDGEWTHIGMNDGLRIGLTKCCFRDDDTGRLAAFMHWLDAPMSWLGLHKVYVGGLDKVFEVLPASLALFTVSIAGNCLFIYCRDRLDRR